MEIVYAPHEVYTMRACRSASLYLAGGITGLDWQDELAQRLKDVGDLIIFNPRRKVLIKGPREQEEQIVWDFRHIRDADLVAFWFSKGLLDPMVMFNLGMWGLSTDRMMFVGVDPDYELKSDVIYQTMIARPDISIVMSLEDMANQVRTLLYGTEE